jgi:hypothetical protein
VFWFYAALTILGIVSVTVSHSGRVRMAGCILLACLLGWGLLQRLLGPPTETPERGQSVSPGTEVAAIALESVDATDLVLTGGGAPFELRGRIINKSRDASLSSVTLSLVRRDCHAGALQPDGCDVIFQDQHWMPLTVPAGETREFVSTIWAHSSVSRARGTIKDEISLAAATGAPSR